MKNNFLPKRIRKRNNYLVKFDPAKIKYAILRAAVETLTDKEKARTTAHRVTCLVLEKISERYKYQIPGVESIQDIVEAVLMRQGYAQIAKNYILYREKRSEIRNAKQTLGLKDDLKLPLNTMQVLRKRYLLKDNQRHIIESPSELFRRVAACVAGAENNFKTKGQKAGIEEVFYNMMRNLEFMPNSPTLMNAGTLMGQLSACFVLPVEDSIDGIFETLKHMAKIHQTGGGTGFSFSRIRPKGNLVYSTKAEASGPISFMSIFDKATDIIVQGGRRRGANMGILACNHPDIIEFIEAKAKEGVFSNFNLSVGASDEFMEAVKKNKEIDLVNPRNNKKTNTVRARNIFDLIVNAAWRTGDPGLVFLDEINRKNPTPGLGKIEATNPCGELPLLPHESCNLGSINLARIVKEDNNGVDWAKLSEAVKWGIRFLDNVIEVNKFPLPKIKEITRGNRKIGLGVMGFADMLISLRIPYNSSRAVNLAANLMRFVRQESLKASVNLAKERGVFKNFKKSIYAKKNLRLRNATVNTVAPTGTISIIAECSSGIEPLFALSFMRNVLSGTHLFEVNALFEEALKKRGLYSKELLARIAQSGSLRNIDGIPQDLKRIFLTAFDVLPAEHLNIQAAFQRYTDNSVSKTINLPYEATVEDVRKIYLRAYELRCKGITIYRFQSKRNQVLSFGAQGSSDTHSLDMLCAQPEYSGGCVMGACPF